MYKCCCCDDMIAEDLRHHKLRYMLKPDDAHSEDSFTFRVNDKREYL